MQHLPTILRARRRREAAARQRLSVRLRPWGLGLLMALGLLAAAAAAGAAWGYASLTADLPSPAALPADLDAPNGLLLTPTQFWDARGAHPLAPAPPAPTYLTPDALPSYAVDALLAAVEPRFWQEDGYVGRFWQTDTPPGIAERLALRLLLYDEPPSLRRRLRARLLAAQLIHTYGHRRVLTWYLNIADFGHDLYGLEAASRAYLGKPAADLTLSEAALLAAALPDPAINPWDAPEQAERARQRLVMALLASGRITADQSAAALNAPPAVKPLPHESTPPILTLARQQLAAQRWPIPSRGLNVATTLDADLQTQADCLRQAVLHAAAEVPNCPAARLLPPLLLEAPLPPNADLEAIVLSAPDGEILALSAPSGPLQPHTPGSALAPWVYAVAFSRGFSPASLTWDVPAALPAGVDAANPDGKFHGPMRLRLALANDDLVPALHLLDQLGPQTVWATAARIGLPALQSQSESGFGLLLGAGHLTLPEIAHGAAAFATLGQWSGFPMGETLQPAALLHAVDAHGNLRFAYQPRRRDVLGPGLAYLVTDILADQAAKWPSLGHPNPLELGRPVAVHLGQATDGGVWVLGFTPRRVVAVYARGDSVSQSRDAALAYWHALARAALAEQPAEGWPRPPNVDEVTVCDPSGLLPTADCPNLVEEVFLQGQEPTAPDNLYRRVAVDAETGLRATIFTPPQLVESRVFMVVPPEARAWARQAGLPLPPEGYDTVPAAQPDPAADLTAPAPFAYVRGVVTLRGTAAGEDFAAYRVQVGQGLNPRRWLVVAEGKQPVRSGVLGQWNTRGMSGLYAVQLIVTDTQGRARTATLQVTVDSQPPQLDFARPLPDETVAVPAGGALVVQADATDDLALAWVRLEVDGKPLATLYAPPYTFAARLSTGKHTLRLVAGDAAGNQSTAAETITISPSAP